MVLGGGVWPWRGAQSDGVVPPSPVDGQTCVTRLHSSMMRTACAIELKIELKDLKMFCLSNLVYVHFCIQIPYDLSPLGILV